MSPDSAHCRLSCTIVLDATDSMKLLHGQAGKIEKMVTLPELHHHSAWLQHHRS